MRKTLYTLAVFILANITINAQSVPVDSHKRIVARAQVVSTEKFLRLLEQGEIDDAQALIDTSFLRSKTQYRDSLTAYHKELSKYLNTTRLSIVVVTPEKKYNTYRCTYHNKKGDYFYIDLYYKKGKSNSKITRILKKPEQELEKERKDREKKAATTPPKTTAKKRKTVKKANK
jgi:hypothetical protein